MEINIIIFSGGQTGADRAALDFAIKHNIRHGGWCPAGRRAEDGILSEIYKLQETPTEDYEERTEWNVRDSDGTVIFSIHDAIEGGTLATLKMAQKVKKPCLHLSQESASNASELLSDFIQTHHIQKLNVAGPRASKEPQVYEFVTSVLEVTLL